jgi:outer membrane biosynthesis protein TonB
LPSQEGKERPWVDLETHAYSLPNEGAQPRPSAPPQESPNPSQAPQPTPISESDQFAMLTSTPRPTVQPSLAPTPEQPRSDYRSQKQQTRIRGNISNRGISSVNALGTPLGRYEKFILEAIGSRWYGSVQKQMDLFGIGTAHIVFSVDRTGHVRNLKIVENTSNELFLNFCIQCVQEAQLPAIPDDVASTLPAEGLDEEISFTVYGN